MKKILLSAFIVCGAASVAASANAADPKAAAKPAAVAAKPAAAPAKGAPAKAQPPAKKKMEPPTFWGAPRELNPEFAGPWARKYALRKGYLTRVIDRACKKHESACTILKDAQKGLNAAFGQCGGFWPNLRMALTSLAKGVSRGSAVKLAPDLSKPLAAIKGACAAAKAGGKKALKPVFLALKNARLALKAKKATAFIKNIRMSFLWLKKPSLWGKPGAAGKPVAGKK